MIIDVNKNGAGDYKVIALSGEAPPIDKESFESNKTCLKLTHVMCHAFVGFSAFPTFTYFALPDSCNRKSTDAGSKTNGERQFC